MKLWNYLLELLLARRVRLELSMAIQKIFHEQLYVIDWMDELKVRLGFRYELIKETALQKTEKRVDK